MTEQFFREFYTSNKDKIEQLQKEVEDLKLQRGGQNITIGELQKENERNVEFAKFMVNCRNEAIRETCILQQEIVDLKRELDRVQCDECMDLQDENIKLEEENAELKSQLASITEDKILEVLEEHSGKDKFGKYFKIYEGVWQRFAQEILQDKGWESIGEVKITEANIDNAGYWFEKYKNKNIEIAVREIKQK